MAIDRRGFLSGVAGAGVLALARPLRAAPESQGGHRAEVALVRATDRAAGVRRALALLGVTPTLKGKSVFLKPNYNSADPAPGSTHPDVLRALVEALQHDGAKNITVGDRSGMGDTRQVMRTAGALDLAKERGLGVVVFDELDADGWVQRDAPGSHWQSGFAIAKPALDADALVMACCLKTHRYGGHFTLSLKNGVGLAAKTIPGAPYNYMQELHRSPHQRRMIAEINHAFHPAFVVMDGLEAFVDGGPDRGKKVQPGVVLASRDRVALDAVGVAILRLHGTTPEVSRGKIFAQEQIARAIELGLGASGPSDIALIGDDEASRDYAASLRPLLER